jgi:hypothetical protein
MECKYIDTLDMAGLYSILVSLSQNINFSPQNPGAKMPRKA